MTSPSTSTSSSSSSFTVGMVELDTTRVKKEREKDLASLDLYWRATNFLSAAQIFLKDNVLLREGPLETKHVKPRLLGHWGTCPGINLVYAHLSRMVRDHNFEAFLVTGIIYI
jgi:xylulose-5-phosphate/fructose-6-phosphate phosphoketolase